MNNPTAAEFCDKFHACDDGREFALQFKTMAEVWDACPRADWLIWIMRRKGFTSEDKVFREFACWCVRNTPLGDGRTVWDLLTDVRSRTAVEVAERFLRGEATLEELKVARRAAAAAWSAAAFAAAAAAAAADAADAAAADAAAAWSAEAAAWSAEAAAWSAARCAARLAQANHFRVLVSNPFHHAEVTNG